MNVDNNFNANKDFVYNGVGYLIYTDKLNNSTKVDLLGNLNIQCNIKEIINDNCFIGYHYNDKNNPVTTLVYNNENLVSWQPKFIALLKIAYDRFENKNNFTAVVKKIRDEIIINKDEVKILEILNMFNLNNEEINVSNNLTLDSRLFFTIIKHIMICEDIKYNKPFLQGKDMFTNLAYDFSKGLSLDEIVIKYGLSK